MVEPEKDRISSSEVSADESRDSKMNSAHINIGATKKVAMQNDCKVKKAFASGHTRSSDWAATDSSEDKHPSGGLQKLILKRAATRQSQAGHGRGRNGRQKTTQEKETFKVKYT